MTPHQILITVIRMLALLWFLYTASNIGTFYGLVHEFRDLDLGLGMLWTLGLLQLAACVLMWMFPATLASKLLRDGNQPVLTSTPIEHWHALMAIGVGLWVLARAVPDVVFWLTFLVLRGREGAFDAVALGLDQIANMVATSIEIAVGVWLLLGGPGLTTFLMRARTAGLRNKVSG